MLLLLKVLLQEEFHSSSSKTCFRIGALLEAHEAEEDTSVCNFFGGYSTATTGHPITSQWLFVCVHMCMGGSVFACLFVDCWCVCVRARVLCVCVFVGAFVFCGGPTSNTTAISHIKCEFNACIENLLHPAFYATPKLACK